MTPSLPVECFLLAAVFVGSVVSGLAGFAFSAVTGGLLLHVLPPSTAVAVLGTCGFILQMVNIWKLRNEIAWKESLVYVVPGFLGIPLGGFLMGLLDKRPAELGFGSILVLYGFWTIFKGSKPENDLGGRPADVVVGFAGGVLGGMLAIPGIPIAIWCNVRGYGKSRQRSLTQPYNAAMLLAAAISVFQRGKFDEQAMTQVGLSLPVLVVGVIVGLGLFDKINETTFRKIVSALLIVSGAALLV